MKDYVKLNEFSEFVAKQLFPSPVTLVLPKGAKIPKWYFPENPNIGLRVPMHDLTQDLLRAFGGPLITTSANLSGGDICFDSDEIIKIFKKLKNKPDLIIQGKLTQHDKASTVIAVESDHVRILREGPITASQLESILGVAVK